MAIAEMTLVSLTLSQQLATLRRSAVEQIPGELAGGFTHDLCKMGFRSLTERVARGDLGRNDDLVRACRRARLLATAFAAKQFEHHVRREGGAWEIDWAQALSDACWKEVARTRHDNYETPRSVLDDKIEQLLASVEGSGDPSCELQTHVIEELIAEVDGWHIGVWGARPVHSSPRPPRAFVARLRNGWPFREPSAGRALKARITERATLMGSTWSPKAQLLPRRLQRLPAPTSGPRARECRPGGFWACQTPGEHGARLARPKARGARAI